MPTNSKRAKIVKSTVLFINDMTPASRLQPHFYRSYLCNEKCFCKGLSGDTLLLKRLVSKHFTHISWLFCNGPRNGARLRSIYGNGTVGAGQLHQEVNALGQTTFHQYDLLGREIYTWGSATYPVAQGYDAYGQRNLLRTFRGHETVPG